MKVLAKIGLIAAAAAAVLFIFLFKFGSSGANRSMADPPRETYSEVKTPDPTIETNTLEDAEESMIADAEETEVTETPLVIPETPEETPAPEAVTAKKNVQMRRIYGKITLSTTGNNLAGVNIMAPGSNVAKISNNTGGYTIQIPNDTRELIFIYRGKKLVQRLSPSDNLLNVELNLDTMDYD